MPQIDTLGRLLLKDAVPEDLRHLIGPLDKKNTGKLYQAIAEQHPEKYRAIAKKIADISTQAGYESGGYSFGIEDMQPHPETAVLRKTFDDDVARVLSDKTLSPQMRDAALVRASLEHSEPIRDSIMRQGLAAKNPLAMQVASGAKGKPENMKALVAGDSLYQDQNFNPVPYPVTRSFAEGLTPAQYFAGTFGARYAIISTKLGTAGGGYLAKRLSNASHRLLVTAPDGPDTHATTRGYPVALDEPDNEGALLAHPVENYPRDTVLTRDVIADLKRRGVKDILARSPMVGGPDDGGVYGKDVGHRERGRISPVGDYVGLAAAQSISEPMTQLIIGCLAKGTLVRMADGSVKTIETIAVGDEVMGADEKGRIEPTKVTNTFDNWYRFCNRYQTESGVEVICTADHKFLGADESGQLFVAPIQDHRALVLAGGGAEGIAAENAAYVSTYDIEVDNDSHLFVLANGLVTSNSKHTGGVAGSTKGQKGFPVLDQLTTISSTFPGGAVHAQHDGIVTSIREAPQGGQYIAVDGKEHYARPDLGLSVKPGDKVEAGDVMTDGIENPSQYVQHKGIGEGRKRFVDIFRNLAAEAGFHPHRRNLELVTRGLIDHVRIEKETDDHVPGDIVSYTQLEHNYDPRPGSKDAPPKELLNHYLERPVLHHTIGTRITPSLLPQFEKYGVQSVTAHAEPPPFSPVMIRSQDIPGADSDPFARMLGSNVEKGLLRGVHRGEVSDPLGTSYASALGPGIDFGQKGKTVGWKPPV